jgi:hypothetical protein
MKLVGTSNTRINFYIFNLVNLRSSHSLGRSLGSPCIEAATLLGVAEVLKPQHLNFPFLLDEREDEKTVIVARVTVNEREYA